MSLVGPRPERPHFVEQLALAIPFYRERSYAKPGLTGWAQTISVRASGPRDAREKLAYDLYYAKHSGLLLDLFILISTVRVAGFVKVLADANQRRHVARGRSSRLWSSYRRTMWQRNG